LRAAGTSGGPLFFEPSEKLKIIMLNFSTPKDAAANTSRELFQ
jgi:hypothetical protein